MQGISFFFLATERIQTVRNERRISFKEAFIQRTWKQSKSLVLQVVPDEEFLHTKIKNKDVYVDYGAAEDIPVDTGSLRQYGRGFDSIQLN